MLEMTNNNKDMNFIRYISNSKCEHYPKYFAILSI